MKRLLLSGLAALMLVFFPYTGSIELSTLKSSNPIDVEIVNFDPSGNQITKVDVDGNGIDAHDGDLALFGNTYYLYGTSYNCGYGLHVVGTAFCGFKVYSSTDLINWADRGYLFDATTPLWQGRCAPPKYGCYQAHVIYNQANNNYVLWINNYYNVSGFTVFTSPDPAGPFTEVADPVLAYNSVDASGFGNGSQDLFVDSDGTGYIVYTRINATPSHFLVIEQLNSSYTSGTGNFVNAAPSFREAPALFKKDGTYELVYSGGCEYCNSGILYTRKSNSILSGWGAETQISSNTCGGQAAWVSNIGSDYLFGADLWQQGDPNQAKAKYFWSKLQFDANNNVQAISCTQTQKLTIQGIVGQPNVTSLNQSSGDYGFKTFCDIASNWNRMQQIIPSKTGLLNKASVLSFKTGATNAPLTISLVRLNQSGVPVGPILYASNSTTVTFGPQEVSINPNVIVYAGDRYGLMLQSTTTTGCYGFGYNDLGQYANGDEFYKSGAGTWTRETNRSLKFDIEIN